jgi:hypothetical protein
VWSCSGGFDNPTNQGQPSTAGTGAVQKVDCSSPNTGCFCSEPGQVIKCGVQVAKSSDYVACALGTRKCSADGVWSACQTTQVVTLNSWQLDGLRLQAQPGPVSAMSACDPTLFEIKSVLGTPDAAIDDGAVTVLDGGAITLTYGAYGEGGATGCGDAGRALVVTPGDASIAITQVATPPSPNSLTFSAAPTGCVVGDASIAPIWSVDQPGIASISDAGVLTLAFPYSGPIHVTAYGGGLSGTALVNVTVNAVDTSGLPAGADAGGIANAFLNVFGSDAGGGG